MRQMRLATGSRINRAEDDSAGYSIANKLEARVRGQAQALANIGDAKSMLTVAEGALNTVMDILQTMKEKVVQAANDTMGVDERSAIEGQLDALAAEIDDLVGDASFNSKTLFTSSAFTFQVNAEAGDTFAVSIGCSTERGGCKPRRCIGQCRIHGAVQCRYGDPIARRHPRVHRGRPEAPVIQAGQPGHLDEQLRGRA
jgi:flagellin